MEVTINTDYPNRVILYLGAVSGPLYSPTYGFFDPTRDLELYVDGQRHPIVSFRFEPNANCYYMFTKQVFNVSGLVQLIHHMPQLPFIGSKILQQGYGIDPYGVSSYGAPA
jgi:hypothetical protein